MRCDAVDRDGHLFVLIGRRTFSAAMNCASLLELHSKATFVGEPTGSRPNFVGESTYFTLPCTRYRVSRGARGRLHGSGRSAMWLHRSDEDLVLVRSRGCQ